MASQNSCDVLLVEDDPNDVLLFQKALRTIAPESQVEVLRDGEEAVKYLASHLSGNSPQLPTIILTDLKMPRLDGLELIEWIRRQPTLSNIPIVMLSSSVMPADSERALTLGANAFFQKPQSREELANIIRAILQLA